MPPLPLAQEELVLCPQIVVADLKAKIAALTETAVNRQRLIFQGKVLKDQDKISAYGMVLVSSCHLAEFASKEECRP